MQKIQHSSFPHEILGLKFAKVENFRQIFRNIYNYRNSQKNANLICSLGDPKFWIIGHAA